MPTARRASLISAAAAPLLLLAGFLLRGSPANPDGELGFRVVFGTLLIFSGWFFSALGWGSALARILFHRSEFFLRAAIGTGVLSLIALALAELGLIGWPLFPLHIALLLAGPLFDVLAQNAPPIEGTAPFDLETPRAERVLTCAVKAALGVLLLLCAIQAIVPDGNPDPLYYDLYGPRLWVQAGRFYLPPSMPILLQCSTWEALGIWAQELLGAPGYGGLFEGQLFMQWAHAIVGGGGCALAMAALLKPFVARPLLRWTVVLSAISAAAVFWTLPLAKNDWGVSFWLLTGAAVLSTASARRDWALGGALVGLGVIGKLTTLFTALPLCVLALCLGNRTWRERFRDGALAAGAAFAIMLPILARNFAASGNPVFPSMNHLFHSPLLSQSWAEYIAEVEFKSLSDLPYIFAKTARLLWVQSHLLPALAVLPLLWLLRQKAPRALPLWLAALASFVLFLFSIGPEATLRLYGPGDVLFCGATALSLLCLFEEMPIRRALSWPLCAAIAALALVSAQARWLVPLALARAPSLQEMLLHQDAFHSRLMVYPPVGGRAKAWLRAHATSQDRILSLEDNRLYYLSPLNVIAVREDPELDVAFRRLPIRAALEGTGANLLITTTDWRDGYREKLDAQLKPLLDAHPEAKVLEADGTLVLDLRALLKP